jgi:predicted amidohydrolase YtcJ
MNKTMHAFAIAAIGFMFCVSHASAQVDNPQAADIIFVNGKIATVNQNFDIVEALAVKEGRITAVGSNDQIRRLASPETRVIDLGGKTVLPGFNDNHIHMGTGAGGGASGENWRGKVDSLDSLEKALREKAEELPTSEWILAGLTRPYFPNDIAPDRHWLDQRVPYHPVALSRGHLMMLNSEGLKRAGISSSTPDPGGGWIIRDETGEPNGQLFENPAKRLVWEDLPSPTPPDHEELLMNLRGRLQALTRLGYSSFNVPGLRPWDLRYFQEAYERWGDEFPRVTIQVRLSPGYDEHDDLEEGVQVPVLETTASRLAPSR